MRDAIGGTVVIVIIVVFIVVSLGYIAFNVNYTKAFRMRNKIVSVYDDFDGVCNSKCENAISAYGKEIGYSMGNAPSCSDPYQLAGSGSVKYCVAKVASEDKLVNDYYQGSYRGYYKVYTKIYMDIPVINKIFDLKVFYIYGTTKTFTFAPSGE